MVIGTAKQAWVSLVVLLLVVLLIVAFAIYWQHMTGINPLHLLADGSGPNGDIGHGC